MEKHTAHCHWVTDSTDTTVQAHNMSAKTHRASDWMALEKGTGLMKDKD